MNLPIRVNDEVYINSSEDVYVVISFNIKDVYNNLTYKNIREITYTLQNKKTGKIVQTDANGIKEQRTKSLIKKKTDELLDDYNVLMSLAAKHSDNDFKVIADGILVKLERGDF